MTTDSTKTSTIWTPLNITIIVITAGILICIAAFIASERPIPTINGYETDILMIAAALGAAFYQINGYFVAKRKDPSIEWGDGYTIKTIVAGMTVAMTIGASHVDTITLYNLFGAILSGLGGNMLISKTVK